ncbi:MAG: hypothetical protein P0S96_01995 [Simkaniaceae bacterium]|nr:hypothetical protein [Candidatus Sacchlamyda saccharinae]
MNQLLPHLPNKEHLIGVYEGVKLPFALRAPKLLYGLTNWSPLDLTDIGIRFYRNLPRKEYSWPRWSAKSILFTATAIRLSHFANLLPKDLQAINAFMAFAIFVSSIKSMTKFFPLAQEAPNLKGRAFARTTTAAGIYGYYALTKAFSCYLAVCAVCAPFFQQPVPLFDDAMICLPDNTTLFNEPF